MAIACSDKPADGARGFLFQSGPYFNGARWYSPDLGRYLGSEPLLAGAWYPSVMNSLGRPTQSYAYAANDPTKFIDPDGRRINVIEDDPEKKAVYDAEIAAAAKDQVIGAWVTELINDPFYVVDIVPDPDRRGAESFPNKDERGCGIFVGRPGRGFHGLHYNFRSQLWHELGHAYGFREWGTPINDAQRDRNWMMSVIFENAARSHDKDQRGTKLHCEAERKCVQVLP
jgi:RHS repeat-associated protein